MKKVFYSLIFMLLLFTFNVKADTCYIGEGNYGNVSTCLLNSLTTGTVKNGTTGSITYNATNNTITFNNYNGSGIILDNFTNDLNIIFIGNNTVNSNEVIYAKTSNSGIDININGEENSTLTLSERNAYIWVSSNIDLLHVENMNFIANDSNLTYIIDSGAKVTEIFDCDVDNNIGASYAFNSFGDLLIIDGCTIVSNDCYEVIYAAYSLELTNTNITASGVTAVIEAARSYHSYDIEDANHVIIEDCNFDCRNVSGYVIYYDYVHESSIKNCDIELYNETEHEFSRVLYFSNSIWQRIVRIENVNVNCNIVGSLLFTRSTSGQDHITYVKNSNFYADRTINYPIYADLMSLDVEGSSFIVLDAGNNIYFYGYNHQYNYTFTDTLIDVVFSLSYWSYNLDQGAIYISGGNIEIIDSIFNLTSTSNQYYPRGIYLGGHQNVDYITDSTIYINGFKTEIYGSGNPIIIENSNIFGVDLYNGTTSGYGSKSSDGIYVYEAGNIVNSSIFVDTTKRNGYTNYGFYVREPIEINNSKINVNINSNPNTNNEYGVYFSNGGDLNNSYVKVKNLYNATPTSTSVSKYGLYSDGDTLIDGSYLDIDTDESIGTAIYNHKGSSDLHGLYFENDDFVLLTPNTGFYKNTYNNTYLYESKYINDPTLIHNTSLDSYHKLLYGRRNS